MQGPVAESRSRRKLGRRATPAAVTVAVAWTAPSSRPARRRMRVPRCRRLHRLPSTSAGCHRRYCRRPRRCREGPAAERTWAAAAPTWRPAARWSRPAPLLRRSAAVPAPPPAPLSQPPAKHSARPLPSGQEPWTCRFGHSTVSVTKQDCTGAIGVCHKPSAENMGCHSYVRSAPILSPVN